MSNKVYDILKFIAQILLPALATLYCAMASIWGLSYAEEITGTVVAIDTFLGVILGISSNQYNKHLKNDNTTIGFDLPTDIDDNIDDYIEDD